MRERTHMLIQGRVTRSGVSLTARPEACRAGSTSEVVGGHGPCIVLEATYCAAEQPRRASVAGFNMCAARTFLGAVSGVNKDNAVTCFQGLVEGKLLSETKRPRLVPMPLLFADLGALPDASQVLEDERAVSSQRVDQPAGGHMQPVPCDAALFTLQARQEFVDSRSAFRHGLKLLAQSGKAAPSSQKRRSEEGEAVAGSDHRVVVQVHTDKPLGIWRLNGLLQNNVNVVPSTKLVIGQRSGFGGLPLEQAFLVAADLKGKSQTPPDSGEADRPVKLSKREDTLVIGNGLGLKVARLAASGLSGFDRVGDATYGLAGQIRRQAKVPAQFLVNLVVQAVATAYTTLQSYIQCIVTGIGECVEHGLQRLFFRADFQLALDSLNEVHQRNYIIKEGGSLYGEAQSAELSGGSIAAIWSNNGSTALGDGDS